MAGLIGYGTNWVAVRMTFQPLEFVGIPPYLGWRGIIPSKARKMASIAVDSTLSKIGTVSDIFEAMDPARIAEHVVQYLEPQIPELVDELMRADHPELWRSLPPAARRAVVRRVHNRLPTIVDALIEDIGEHIDGLVDIRLMVTELLADDRELLNRIFQRAGADEFRFLINSGLYFGLLLGLLQMVLQITVGAWWVLPGFGVFVGYATNWLALNLIFRPREPVRLGPVLLWGLFLRRRREIATAYCRLVTREIITIGNIVEAMLEGPAADRTRALIVSHVRAVVDETAGVARPMLRVAVGRRDYADLKDALSTRMLQLTPEPFDDPAFNEERARRVEETLRARMLALSPSEFQQLLRPAFQEDELKLILVGAALGGLAGLAQSMLVFA